MLINLKMLKLSKEVRKILFLTSFIQLMLLLFSIGSALCIAQTIASLSAGVFAMKWVVVLCVTTILSCLVKSCLIVSQTKCSGQIKTILREAYVRKLFSLGVLHQESNRTGDLTTTGVMRIEAIGLYFSVYLPSLFSAMLVTSGMIVWIAHVNRTVALICAIGFLGVLIVPAFWYSKIYSKGNEVWKLMASYRSDLIDNIQGMACLRNLSAQAMRREQMREKGLLMHRKTMSNLSVNSVESLFIYLFCGLGAFVSIAYAAHITAQGRLNSQMLVLLLFLITASFAPVYSLVNAWHIGFNGLTGMTNLTRILEKSGYSYADGFGQTSDNSLVCEKVSFSYPESSEKAVSEASFTAQKGQTIAFVGRSGEGKTTLISLIAGLYPFDEGTISFDNTTLNQANSVEWLSNIGAIWQEQYLFDGSIRDNLLIAKKNASDEEIIHALTQAQLLDFVWQQPAGLNTQVGERGGLLSGGEKQRLALARLFLKDPEILIFDEATSNLDEENQSNITEVIKAYGRNKLVIIISHRVSTFAHADCIYYLEQGRIVDCGKHEELMNRCEGYEEIVRQAC